MERGIERGRERGKERGTERGKERGTERGMERGIERGGRERGKERGTERGIERGIERGGRERGTERGIERERGKERADRATSLVDWCCVTSEMLSPEQVAGGLLRIDDVARLLNIKRRTVYTIPFLWQRVIYVAPRAPRWEPADIELYKRINTGRAA